MAPKILVVLTSHNKIDALDKPSGWYLPEFAHPYYKFAPSSSITVVSPKGGEAPLDPSSVEASKDDAQCQQFLSEQQSLWKNTEVLGNYAGKASTFDAIFFVGGHGPMYDLVNDSTSQGIIREFYESGKVVSAVCHGPAALLNVKLSDGSYLVANQKVTGFSNAEEDTMGLSSAMPFALETQLKKNAGDAGGFEVASAPFGAKVVVSGKNGKLLTGQNPASAAPLAEAVLKAVGT